MAFGGDDGELVLWGVETLSLTTGTYSRQAPNHLRIARLWYFPDVTQLVIEHFYERDDMIGPALSASSILFKETGNWLQFGLVDATFIGWSPDDRRFLGTCETFEKDGIWVVQLDAWMDKCVARISINAKAVYLRTIYLARKGIQVSWCTQPYKDGWRDTRLMIDTILF